jgi:hypothetical protein
MIITQNAKLEKHRFGTCEKHRLITDVREEPALFVQKRDYRYFARTAKGEYGEKWSFCFQKNSDTRDIIGYAICITAKVVYNTISSRNFEEDGAHVYIGQVVRGNTCPGFY